VSARESIENLWDRATPVGPLLDAYAHELAEKQRAWAREPGQVLITVELPDQLDSIVKASVDIAAALIDPQKEAPNGAATDQ
jgi:hypothetical protein